MRQAVIALDKRLKNKQTDNTDSTEWGKEGNMEREWEILNERGREKKCCIKICMLIWAPRYYSKWRLPEHQITEKVAILVVSFEFCCYPVGYSVIEFVEPAMSFIIFIVFIYHLFVWITCIVCIFLRGAEVSMKLDNKCNF